MTYTGTASVLSSGDYEAEVHFDLAPYNTESDIDMGQFFSAAKGVTVNGEVGLNGDLSVDKKGIKSSLKVNVMNTNLTMGIPLMSTGPTEALMQRAGPRLRPLLVLQ